MTAATPKRWIRYSKAYRGKGVYHKPEGSGSPSFEHLHPLHPLELSSRAEFLELSHAVKEQSCHRSPWWWLSPAGVRRAALGAVMSAAGAAEAGIVLVTTELGLQDQVTVGKVGLVHTLSAQVHSVTHSSCSQAKGEPAVNLSSDCYSFPKDITCSCFLHPTTSKFSPTSGRRWWVSRWNRHLWWDTREGRRDYPLCKDSWMVSKVQLQIMQPTIWSTNYGIFASES